jgi:hypothetical protein
MIEQQERIEIIERPRADASPEPDPGALDNGLRFDNLQDFSWRAHFWLLSIKAPFNRLSLTYTLKAVSARR